MVEWVDGDRTTPGPSGVITTGSLRAALTTPPAHGTGPLAALGSAVDFYGTLTWPETIAAVGR